MNQYLPYRNACKMTRKLLRTSQVSVAKSTSVCTGVSFSFFPTASWSCTFYSGRSHQDGKLIRTARCRSRASLHILSVSNRSGDNSLFPQCAKAKVRGFLLHVQSDGQFYPWSFSDAAHYTLPTIQILPCQLYRYSASRMEDHSNAWPFPGLSGIGNQLVL